VYIGVPPSMSVFVESDQAYRLGSSRSCERDRADVASLRPRSLNAHPDGLAPSRTPVPAARSIVSVGGRGIRAALSGYRGELSQRLARRLLKPGFSQFFTCFGETRSHAVK
jgi:hypothetical protein